MTSAGRRPNPQVRVQVTVRRKARRNHKDGRGTSPPDVKNEEIAARFSEIADMLDILGEDTFRVLSYQRAARQLESLTENVEDLVRAGRGDQIPGPGPAFAEKIKEELTHGRNADHH